MIIEQERLPVSPLHEKPTLRVLILLGDLYGCRLYRCRLPALALTTYGVETDEIAFLPNIPGAPPLPVIIDKFKDYDMIILQRCYLRHIVEACRHACDYLGIPLVFETDDDYLNIPVDNPAHLSMIDPSFFKSNPTREQVEEQRQKGLNNYKQILGMMDAITVSTEELRRTILPYNRKVEVFQNNVERVFPYRSFDPENAFIEDGVIKIPNMMGVITVPSYAHPGGDANKIILTPRVGYTGTITHRNSDFNTIAYHYSKVIKKFAKQAWFVYIGDGYFANWHKEELKREGLPERIVHIPDSFYDSYLFHIRNLDIGMAPLARNVFNMSKSDIKAVEYATWGVPAVLPNFVTYSRSFKNNETALLYDNGAEFKDAMETILNDHNLRHKLGENAKKYVSENRLEKLHAKRRFDFYKSLVDKTYKLKEMKAS